MAIMATMAHSQDPSLWSRPGREGGRGDEEAGRCGSRADHPISIPQFHIPVPGSAASIQSGTETCSSVQCPVSRQLRAWRSFSPCWGEQRSCKLSGEGGREAVSGVKGSKHTAQHQSGGAKLQESLSPPLLTLCFLNPDLDRYQEYKDSQGSSSSPPLCVHPTPDTTVAS